MSKKTLNKLAVLGLAASTSSLALAAPVSMNFDAGAGSPSSYTEGDMTVTSHYGGFPGGGHLHLGNYAGNPSPDLYNHSSCCSTPYVFERGGDTFDFLSLMVESHSGTSTFTASNGDVVSVTGTGQIVFPPSWQQITSVTWQQDSGGTVIDNLVYDSDPLIPFEAKPGSCRNPVNVGSKGVTPGVVFGTAELDVSTIDAPTAKLVFTHADGITTTEVSVLRTSLEDTSTPYNGVDPSCEDAGPDGFVDLQLKFETQSIVTALEASGADMTDGTVHVLSLTATKFDGTTVNGEDVIEILVKGKK